ncbi:DNA alkylation repair protein [Gemelliphila palaticanis]|uniref:DNA alkylation repair protein n=1 Tax=Gemelliphila palaticanis TaxID=81950 RepID=A0ABX2T0N4_9BACL|nr:DNA alkylation repair protein [Gemella palaticanis]MBF0715059.1 DNA alkylation repair protein [Gemella palaticanis]NYS46989.1 DNA alkylation repair protein [Gemella palaticanis]
MLNNILESLKQKSNSSVIKRYEKLNEPKPYYGVLKGEINKIAKNYAPNNKLAIELWETKNLDAQILSINIFDYKTITKDDIEKVLEYTDSMTSKIMFVEKIIASSNLSEYYRVKLSSSEDIYTQSLGWRLNVKYLSTKKVSSKEIDEILEYIELNLLLVDEPLKWAMNYCLVTIALSYSEYLNKCLDLSKKLGVYKDQKVSKGCTSAYAPDWISAVLKRKDK